MNEITVCLTAWVATEPTMTVGPSGVRMTSFRIATTSRYFDQQDDCWKDGRTEWFVARAYRAAALSVKDSIKKGEPIIIKGYFRTSEWEADSGPRTDLVLDIIAIGHDLTRGSAQFSRNSNIDLSGNDVREAQRAS